MTTITTATITITAPTTPAAASSTITAEMICADLLQRRTRCYWW